MSFLYSSPDPKEVRALKLFLIATLAVGALASLVAKPVPVAVAPWAIAPFWTLSYGSDGGGGLAGLEAQWPEILRT